MGALGTIDYIVILAYLGGTIALGLYVGRGLKTGADLFLGGRRLTWWAVGMSLVATDIGGVDIIGVGGAAYQYGLAVGNFEWIGCIPPMILAAFVFIPFFWRAGVYTVPEFMERRYNAGVRVALASCWFVFMACNLGLMLLASAKMMKEIFHLDFTGWMLAGYSLEGMEPALCIVVTAILVGIYTSSGGMTAVVYTDVVQCVVMISGCLLVLVIGLVEVGGLDALIEKIHALDHAGKSPTGEVRQMVEHTSIILPVDTQSPFPWSGILFGLGMVLGPAYWIGNQAIVQRSFGTRSEYEAKAAFVSGALLKNLIPFIICGPGLVAVVLYPDLKEADDAFPTLVARVLPIGVRGAFVAAFVAALMSSVDSYLNSAATVFVNDFYKRFFRPNTDESSLLVIGRWTTVILVVWAIIFAFWLSTLKNQGIYAIFQTMMAFFQGPALAILLAGILSKRATGTAALVGFLGGVLTSVTLFALNLKSDAWGWKPLFQIADPFLYFSVWAFLVAMTLIIVVSMVTPREPREKLLGLVYGYGPEDRS